MLVHNLAASWPAVFGSFAGFFLLFNLAFAALYELQPSGIANLNPPGYWGMFFFSVETLAIVGYGDMYPQSLFAHILAATEIFIGMMSVGLIAGVMFSRFSRPIARFVFADHVVIRPFDGQPTLMLRAANARQNVIMEGQAQLHVIDASSPLHGESPQSLALAHANLLLTVSSTDETTGQTLMARKHYPVSALHWNHTFADILTQTPDGRDRFDYTKFQDIQPFGGDIDWTQRTTMVHRCTIRWPAALCFSNACECRIATELQQLSCE